MKIQTTFSTKLASVILLFLIFQSGYAQQQDAHHVGFISYEANYERFASEFGNFIHDNIGIRRLKEEDIQGSAYLNSEFTPGTVYTKKKVHYTDIPLRYNIYNDVIEFQLKNDSIYAISNPEIIRQIVIDDETFFYYRTAYDKAGYYSLKQDGEVQLLSKYNIGFQDEELPNAFTPGKPASFQPKANTYFLKLKGEIPVKISKKNDLKRIFGNKRNAMLSFIKKENLNIREEKDLLKLVAYINKDK